MPSKRYSLGPKLFDASKSQATSAAFRNLPIDTGGEPSHAGCVSKANAFSTNALGIFSVGCEGHCSAPTCGRSAHRNPLGADKYGGMAASHSGSVCVL